MICLKRSDAFEKDKSVCEVWEKRCFADTKISSRGGHTVAHRAILSSASSFLKELFLDIQDIDDTVLVLDGFRFQDIENLISFIYHGEVYLNSHDMLLLKGLMKVLMIEKQELSQKTIFDEDVFMIDDVEVEETILGYVCEAESKCGPSGISEREGAFFYDEESTSHIEVHDQEHNIDPLPQDEELYHQARLSASLLGEGEEHCEEIGDIIIKTVKPRVAKIPTIVSESPRKTKEFTCERCKKKFRTIEDLEVHAALHSNESKVNECPFCSNVFASPSQCAVHIKVFHEEVACKLCSVVMSNKRLKTHMKAEHDILHDGDQVRATRCLPCNKLFTKSEYKLHYAKMHSSSKKELRDTLPVQCPHCTRKFSSTHLNYHIRLNHSVQPVFNCNQCKKIFRTPESRDEHKQFCVQATTVCNFCNETYRPVYRKTHLMRHVREKCADIMADEDGFYQCCSCERKFEHQLFLENHMFGHFWPRCKYECSDCASVFVLKGQVDAHVQRCSEETDKVLGKVAKPRPARPAVRTTWTNEERELGKKCTICSRLVKSSGWSSHMLNHEKVNGELTEQYSCDACDKFFFRRCDVEKHILFNHRKDGKKQCSKCKKLFASLRVLEKHRPNCRKVYTKICPVCNQEIDLFQRIAHLKAHAEDELEASGCSTTLRCPRCSDEKSRKFANCEYLINHMINHYEPFREFECDICLLGFKTKIILEKHKAGCNGPAQKMSKVGLLKKRSSTVGLRKNIDDEKLRRGDEMLNWKCPACLTLFDTEVECEDHIFQVHSSSKEENESEFLDVFT